MAERKKRTLEGAEDTQQEAVKKETFEDPFQEEPAEKTDAAEPIEAAGEAPSDPEDEPADIPAEGTDGPTSYTETDSGSEDEKEEDEKERAALEARLSILENDDVDFASDKVRNSLYSSEHVIPVGTSLHVETTAQRRKKEFLELVSAHDSGKILTGEVTATRVIQGMPCAVVKYGEFFYVLIPYDKFIKERPHETEMMDRAKARDKGNSTANELTLKKKFLNQRLLTDVDFTVTAVVEETGFAIGNRIRAMAKKARRYFFAKNSNGEYYIKDRQKLEARILMVRSNYMVVEACGIEKRLEPRDIARYYIPDCRKEYQQGGYVIVRVKNISREIVKTEGGREYKVDCDFSMTDAEPDMRKEMLKIYKVGSVVSAVVVGITDKGIFSRLENTYGKMDIFTDYSLYPRDRIPKLYSRVTVRINGINEKKMQIWGPIVNEDPEITE